MRRILNFLKEVKEELQKISYPDKQGVINATKSISIIVFFTAVYMEIIDFILRSIFKYVLRINI
ncbi:MAG: preprotein translocase subunit SecE [Candidatus Calescibacterium sp.]|nr:preprotein translocase subunit SecE [Candidatus Calescibacterium sp.]MCX7971966.1 preprotein translocase subunit SecE [bacterium]MDW8195448.1 preprotein translocase subunit SecE [Candidatus Calescibacterium sp.]